jgi:hypothetical protein
MAYCQNCKLMIIDESCMCRKKRREREREREREKERSKKIISISSTTINHFRLMSVNITFMSNNFKLFGVKLFFGNRERLLLPVCVYVRSKSVKNYPHKNQNTQN